MTNNYPGIVQGAYWIRNGSFSTKYLGLSPDQSLAVGQDKFTATKALRDHSQIWLAELLSDGSSFTFRNAETGRVLDVKGSLTEDGVPIILWSDTGNPNQKWSVEWIDDRNDGSHHRRPRYRLVNRATKKVIDQTSTSDWPEVSWSWNGGPHQLWSFEPASLPTLYRIGNVSSGRYLQYNASSGATTNTKLPSTDKSLGQFWFLEYKTDGSDRYFIRNVEDDNKVLDLFGASIKEGNSIITFNYHGGQNQQWGIDYSVGTAANPQARIVSALGSVAVQENSSQKVEARNTSSSTSQYWRLEQYPMPSLFWATIQNLQSGIFLGQNETNKSQVIPSTGSRNALDYTVQWRFVPEANQPFNHFTIVNRATGWILLSNAQSPSIYAAARGGVQTGYLWASDAAGGGIGIFNTNTLGVLDHYAQTTIEAKPYPDWADNPLRRWIPLPVADSLPSFAIVNARTGRFVSFVSASQTNGVKTVAEGIQDFSNQWLFDNSSPGAENGVFTIISKASGMVLDHYDGRRIEAYTDDTVDDSHHRWKLIPCSCGERYFEIVNVSTGHHLEERTTGTPNANAIQPMDPSKDDRAQCWDIVSSRGGTFDNLVADDDVLSVLLPYLQQNDATELKHRIEKRSPGRGKKGKNKTAAIPRAPNLLRDVAPTIREIFGNLINQWEDDRIPSNTQASTRASTTRREVVEEWGINVPQLLRDGWNSNGWIRIDIQGTYEAASGQRVANIQGQWNAESVFHVIVPVNVVVGAERIRQAMRDSLETGTTVDLTATETGSSGGPLPGTKPPPPPGPSGKRGNGWVFPVAIALLAVMLLPLGM